MARFPDYFDQNIIITSSHDLDQHDLVRYVYPDFASLAWPTDTLFALNLQWPTEWCNLPTGRSLYVLTFHLEQIDIEFVKKVAQTNSTSRVLVITDNDVVPSTWWPANCDFVSWITWHKQLDQIALLYGIASEPNQPTHKLSSLCFRTDQFKHYVTGYLLEHADLNDCIISYHGQHQHRYFFQPSGRPVLDHVLSFMQARQPHMEIDGFDASKNYPMANCDWHVAPYTDAAVNFTNEGFHYSYTVKDGVDFYWPGPYVTEKTWKPLLAGCAFVSVGQAHIYQYLEQLGLRFDYGLDLSYDLETRDFDRIEQIFRVIDQTLTYSTKELTNLTRASTQHNLNWIANGEFRKRCDQRNQLSLEIIKFKLVDL
jgi:hypothetical protein